MQTSVKKTANKKTVKDETPTTSKKTKDERKKNNVISTPRNFINQSSTTDIYSHNKGPAAAPNAPKKALNTSRSITNASPMKGQLKSSSSLSLLSKRSGSPSKLESKAHNSKKAITTSIRREPPFVNVTINSPLPKKKIATDKKEVGNHLKTAKDLKKEGSKVPKEKGQDRARTNTRTLNDDEVKVLTPDAVNNSEEMATLRRKLAPKPKAFYVDLEDEQSKKLPQTAKSSDEEASYEDDFESYESDFDSYHSDGTAADVGTSSRGSDSCDEGTVQKDAKDDENMLDSGNFDLREAQRSGNRCVPAAMEYILEQEELDKKSSLTDEGFQDMSSTSNGTSLQNEPLFLDFRKSKEKRKKRRVFHRLEQRAKDLLSMITLHEMSYNLFEMKPIPYDLYMATFGRNNYAQTSVQTFDDGASVGVQTEDIVTDPKWTQNPIEFSKYDICCQEDVNVRKRSESEEDFVHKFSNMLNDVEDNGDSELVDKDYEVNPLRVYLEQKDGVGSAEMLPYEAYTRKLQDRSVNNDKLAKFLNRIERKICNALSVNGGSCDVITTDYIKPKIPFSKGYVVLPKTEATDNKTTHLKDGIVSKVIFSKTKDNLFIIVYGNTGNGSGRSLMCLWDINNLREPIKYLVAIDTPTYAQFFGTATGLFVAALKDGSIHVWDLSEEATWRCCEEQDTHVDVSCDASTKTRDDREMNSNSYNVGMGQLRSERPLQASAYTSSGDAVMRNQGTDDIIGLEIDMELDSVEDYGTTGRKITGRVYALTTSGELSIWNIVQDKSQENIPEIGKAFNSKIKLERHQSISMSDYLDFSMDILNQDDGVRNNFSLNAAKKRLLARKQEKKAIQEFSRPRSTASSRFESDRRPDSAASGRRSVLPLKKSISKSWENVIVCYDLKLLKYDGMNYILMAKNCGEVLCCKKGIGGFKCDRLLVATDTSSVLNLAVICHELAYFLAATDSGTINLWSLLDSRVLLTLDCRNSPPAADSLKCQSDFKGRYISTIAVKATSQAPVTAKISVTSLNWSPSNPCSIVALTSAGTLNCFDLATSDIYAKHSCERAAVYCTTAGDNMALLTIEGDVQIHKMETEHRTNDNLELFRKYLTLL